MGERGAHSDQSVSLQSVSDQSVWEATAAAQEAWVEHVNAEADQTLFPRANSWYIGANIAGKPRVILPYTGGVGKYREVCDEVAAEGYRGFVLATT